MSITLRFEQIDIEDYTLADIINLNREKIGNFVLDDKQGFRFSQVIDSLFYYYSNNPTANDTINIKRADSDDTAGYIIPIAVTYHPNDWTGNHAHNITTRKSIFESITPKYLADLQNGKAMLLIDQSVEGYSATWLWAWFHSTCEKFNLNPSCIIYLTGDQSCVDTYSKWCSDNEIQPKLNVIPSISLSMYIKKHYQQYNITTDFNEILDYKRKNAETLYLFDCTNMRPRPQRVLNYLHLIQSGLIDKGNISMPSVADWQSQIDIRSSSYFTQYKLPSNVRPLLEGNSEARKVDHGNATNTQHYYNFVERILDSMYKNSWVSLVTESSYFQHEFSVFIRERTFKPIACMQPFIIVGSKHSLKYLRQLGYKTFSPFIDESYDELDDADRFEAITNAVKQIERITDKASWYESMREILEHNFNLFQQIGRIKSIEHIAVDKYYSEYFKDINV